MTRARSSAGASTAFAGGVSAVQPASALDACPDDAARAVLEAGGFFTLAPKWLADAGGYVVGVTWSGLAFRVYDTAGDLRAVTASWAAVEAMMAVLAAEWDASA